MSVSIREICSGQWGGSHDLDQGLPSKSGMTSIHEIAIKGLSTHQLAKTVTTPFSLSSSSITVKGDPITQNPLKDWPKLARLAMHFTTNSADKYVRLVYAIIKLTRTFDAAENLNKLNPELLQLRRTFRWSGLFDMESFRGQQALFSKSFRLFQYCSDLLDFITFFLRYAKSKQNITHKLEQYQSNFYFVECCVFLARFGLKFIVRAATSSPKDLLGKPTKDTVKMIKYLCDCLTSFHNTSWVRRPLPKKLVAMLGVLSSVLGVYLLWQ